jgi:molybdopterin-guanine dinucleotide biosynthesis protein A
MAAALAGTILAGGRARRMAGCEKALALLGGRPLVQHVIDRIAPQVAELALSVERQSAAYDRFARPQLADPVPGHRGPLGGLLAALRHFSASYEWVLLAPCDAPFLPLDLGVALYESACAAAADCAMVRFAGELQPTFSLWHRRLLPDLEQAVLRGGQAGFKQFLPAIEAAECDWPATRGPLEPPPFFNINEPAALREAARWVRPVPEEYSECSA